MSTVVSVIAGGWSFREVDHHKVPGTIIVINDGLVFFERPPDFVCSMDRLWTEERWEHIKEAKRETYIRRNALKRLQPDPSWLWFHKFENNNDGRPFTTVRTHMNGASSGACGLNLAYTMKPTELYMFGFDMCVSPKGEAHWYPQYQWAKKTGTGYNSWPRDFETYALQFMNAGCKVLNVSRYSKITSFRRVSPQELGIAK